MAIEFNNRLLGEDKRNSMYLFKSLPDSPAKQACKPEAHYNPVQLMNLDN